MTYQITKRPSRPRLNTRYIKNNPIETIINDEVVCIETLTQMSEMNQDSFDLLSDADLRRLTMYFADVVSFCNRNQRSLIERGLTKTAKRDADILRVKINTVKTKLGAELSKRLNAQKSENQMIQDIADEAKREMK